MREYLLEKKEDIEGMEVKPREIEFLKTKAVVQTVIGPRRAGKSFSLFFWIKKLALKDKDYLFVNFEDDDVKYMDRSKKVRCIDEHVEIYGKEPKYIFFDEIQELENWESFIYSLVEKKRYVIFVTGSTSRVSSREVATQLRGRAITKVVLPFNFREYLGAKPGKILSRRERAKIKHALHSYLSYTGFPQVLIDNISPKIFIREYLETVVFRDLVEKYRIENTGAVRFLLRRCISNFAKKFSVNKVYNELKSAGFKVGKATLYEYLHNIEELMIVFSLKKFAFSERKSELSTPKIYLCDHGLTNYSMKTKFSEEFGRLMENTVFLELKRKNMEEGIDLFYFQDSQQHEVDFVVKEGLKVKELIQVTYANSFDEIEHREIRALLKAGELLKCRELRVITWDYEDEKEVKWFGREGRIKFIPLWKWLMKRGS